MDVHRTFFWGKITTKTHKNVQILKKYTEDFVEKTVVSKLHSKCPEEHSAKKLFVQNSNNCLNFL